jgi:hypothetical protein
MTTTDDGPIFIIGNPRSGTTLLRLMLTCHPRIVVPPEAGFLIDLRGRHGGFAGEEGALDRFLVDLQASPKFEYWKLPDPVLREFLRGARPRDYASLVAGVYACYASAHGSGKPRWDRSLADVKGKYAPTLPGDVFGAMYDWNRNLRRIRRAFARVGWNRVHELRYEDLVQDPEGVLRRSWGRISRPRCWTMTVPTASASWSLVSSTRGSAETAKG